MKKYTREEFIEKCIQKHNNFYSYDKTEYVNNDTKILVTCKEHGDFYITAKNHISGQKCRACAYKYRNNRNETKEIFVSKAIKVHGHKYDYSKVEYKNTRSKVLITCKTHGDFHILPANHIQKQGCKLCGIENSNLIRDEWIKKCADRKCIFYIVKCWNDKECFYKFGITSLNIKKRFAYVPYQHEVLKKVETYDSGYVWDLEKRFKRVKRNAKYIPTIKFSGMTECFK